MLVELPEWLSKLLTPCAIDRYINDAGGYRRITALHGKRVLARAEPLSYSCAFDEAAMGLAAVSCLVAAALLVQRHDVLAPSAVEMLQPVDGAHEHASVAHLHVYKHTDHDGAGAYSPHVDGGLLTLVACPAADRCLVVQLPGGGEEHVALEPGVAAVLPGMSLGMDPQPCSVSRLPTLRTRPRGIAWTRGRPPAATVPASPSTCGRTLTCPSAAARRRGSTWRPSTAACSASTRLQPPVLHPLLPAGLAQPMELPAAPRLPLQGPSASRSAPSQESRGVSGISTRRRLWRS